MGEGKNGRKEKGESDRKSGKTNMREEEKGEGKNGRRGKQQEMGKEEYKKRGKSGWGRERMRDEKRENDRKW